MAKYIVKRILWMIPIILGVTVVVYTLMYFCPGDPARVILGNTATDADIQVLRDTMGLNDSFFVQLFNYIKSVFLHGDLGTSYLSKASVTSEILVRLPRSILLAALSMIISVIIGLPLGVISAVNQDGILDRICMVLALVGVSIPSFWLASMLILVFSMNLGWLPAMGLGGAEYYVLPAMSGALGGIAAVARQSRSSMLEIIRADYVTTARSKGITANMVILRHALPNALIPIITLIGGQFAALLGGMLILENIFIIPGMGTYIVTAISNRDYPVVLGGSLVLAIVFSLIMLIVDVMYAYVDPRIKAQYTAGSVRGKKA